MNRHWKNGYQTNFKNDLYHVEDQLQAYDPHLYVMYSPNDGTWMVMDAVTELAVMKIPQIGFETLDSRVVERIKRIHTAIGFSASWEIEQAEERRKKESDRKINDIAQDYAKELLPAAREAFATGRTEGVKAYY